MKKSLVNIISRLISFETKEEIIKSFTQEVCKVFKGCEIHYSELRLHPEDIEISCGKNEYGFLNLSGNTLISSSENDEIKSSAKIVAAIILSKENSFLNKNSNGKNDFYQILIDTIPEPIFYKNKEGKYLGCNKAFADFLSMKTEEIIGKTVFEMGPKELTKTYFEKDKELFENPGKQVYEWSVQNKSGERNTVKINKATFNNNEGKVEGIVGIITDITQAKENEKKLKHRLEVEKLVSTISAHFFEESESNLDSSINYALKALGEFWEVDRSYVFLFDEHYSKMTNTHEWYAEGVISYKENFAQIPTDLFAWGVKKILSKQELIVNDVEKLADKFKKVKTDFKTFNVKSAIVVPIITNKRSIGFLGFATEKKIKQWDRGYNHILEVVGGFISVALEKKKYINELKETENKFNGLVEQSLTGIYIIKENKFQYVNRKLAEIFGYSVDEIINNCAVSDLVFEDDREIVKDNLSKRILGETDALHYTFRGIKKDGGIISVDVHGSKTIMNGVPVVVGILIDITERVKIENSLRKLSKAVEQSSATVLVTDVNGNIEYVNPSFTEITGYSRDEVMNKNPRFLKSHLTSEEHYKEMWRTITSGNNWKGEILNKKKNGELYWELNSISPIKNEKGEITHFVAVKEDITAQKKMIDELQATKEAAEKANKLKTEFLAQISHEIRTPVNILLSFSNLIWDEAKDKVSKDLKDNYELINRAGNRIIRTIDLILNLSQIQIGTYEIHTKKINLNKHFTKIILPEYEYKSKNKGLKLNFVCSAKNMIVDSDEYMFEQIFTNLLDNAIKYTEEGSIDVIIDRNGDDKIYVDIVDTGIGISKEYLPKLFELFSQEEQGYTRKFEGNGLGLALVKNYCELNNAKITVESKKGIGSKFRVAFLNSNE